MHTQKGFSLLETMIAGVVTSLGLSGVAALLIAAVAGTSGSGHRAQALDLAVQAAEAMRLSPTQEAVFLLPPPATAPSCGPGTTCDAFQFATANYHHWHLQIALALPGGAGTVCLDGSPDDGDTLDPACDGSGEAVVKVFWDEPGGGERVVLEALP